MNLRDNKASGTESKDVNGLWESSGRMDAIHQIADLCRRLLPLDIKGPGGGSSFHSSQKAGINQSGISTVSGRLTDEQIITLQMELVKGHDNTRVCSAPFFMHLSQLGNKVRLCTPHEKTNGEVSLCVEIDIKAELMDMKREMNLQSEIKRINELAKLLQAELPERSSFSMIINQYKEYADVLQPVEPLDNSGAKDLGNLFKWAEEIANVLSASLSVAVSSLFRIEGEYAMSALAGALGGRGETLGYFMPPAVGLKDIPMVAQKAPGKVIISAMRMNMGNIYEMSTEVEALLATLTTMHKPVVFTGTYEQLQTVFHGGQGGANDALFPIVCHAPEAHINDLARFSVNAAARRDGGLTARDKEEVYERTLSDIQNLSLSEQKRILPVVVERYVYLHMKGYKVAERTSSSFASRIAGYKETLSGLTPRPRVSRLPEVQEQFLKVLTDPDLIAFFQEHLIAQDRALQQLVEHLRMETLTRPQHQPIRYCAQGTPATGKSESAVLIAQRLGIPYVNIDAASMSDFHTASSQLLGSGRGIVMSYRAGRLEQVAKQNSGVVLEISDLDHATPSVRSGLADLFLQVLETGESQSATGAMFSCANVIFAFTMNLPDGLDETARKKIGFNSVLSREDVAGRVVTEIKKMLSGAFVSRVGTPILFDPLDGDAMAAIAERAVVRAVSSAAQHLRIELADVSIEEGLGLKIISWMKANVVSFGARAIHEHGRTLAAKAFMEFHRDKAANGRKDCRIHVSATDNGRIVIKDTR